MQVAQLDERGRDPSAERTEVLVEQRARSVGKGLLSRRPSPISGLVSTAMSPRIDGSGCPLNRCTRSTISISIAGSWSSTSSTYHRRYDVWLHDGQSKFTWATTRGGCPSPGRP
ncbi:MAG: hypothetical protein FD127_632 [Acidimicrobiaceae bacterium]|nr:MAG: hypothetical protein FD127_632 [Acidimicrobiaceae bacterium]